MSFTYRARAWWACLSILFNQTVHFGGAPYPYTFSETCYLRQHMLRYYIPRVIIDFVFALFGEAGHCQLSYETGRAFRQKDQI